MHEPDMQPDMRTLINMTNITWQPHEYLQQTSVHVWAACDKPHCMLTMHVPAAMTPYEKAHLAGLRAIFQQGQTMIALLHKNNDMLTGSSSNNTNQVRHTSCRNSMIDYHAFRATCHCQGH